MARYGIGINLDAARAVLVEAMRPSWQIWCECGSFRGVVYAEPSEAKAQKPCMECRSVNLVIVKQNAKATVDAAHLADALAVVDALTAEVAQLKEQIAHPIHCPACGSCGESGCCPTPMCRYLNTHQGDYDEVVRERDEALAQLAEATCATVDRGALAAGYALRREEGTVTLPDLPEPK